ncbi:hypothetical protein MLD38_003204 [Melastoma candidum]|uniref:Uncharacterized protein n=1 Tax=Melastoma candidum TaxID=119954 RepID=A0ACB9S502_9MYRT|nr:hypothetical protein MLD38_003204 [Melastoma candidum]
MYQIKIIFDSRSQSLPRSVTLRLSDSGHVEEALLHLHRRVRQDLRRHRHRCWHNGLTAAAYLARSGLSVAVLGRRHVIGGAAVTEEIVPGFKFSRCSYLQSLLRPTVIKDFMELLLSPASKVLNKWFESDVLKATLATDAVIGATGSINTPGSGYVLLHHVMGETDGDRGIWSYVEGGMGSVSLSICKSAKGAGADILTNAEVSQLMINETGKANGVVLADGVELRSSVVLSNATPYRTFMELVPNNILPEEFVRSVKNVDYSSATTKINLAVDKLPHFVSCKLNYPDSGPQHLGTIHIGSERMDEIDIACQESVNGFPSSRPIIEMTIPSVLDQTLCPPGKHVINLFIQYTPYNPSDGSWTDPAYRNSFANRCFSLIDEYAPGFSSSIIGYDMLTPPDLEREIGLTGGNIFHGAMGLDALFLMRPVKGWSNYRTPVPGLYLCGSGAHPGGGVMGAPGRNAAQLVLHDLKRRS